MDFFMECRFDVDKTEAFLDGHLRFGDVNHPYMPSHALAELWDVHRYILNIPLVEAMGIDFEPLYDNDKNLGVEHSYGQYNAELEKLFCHIWYHSTIYNSCYTNYYRPDFTAA